jgi:type I restriction enzyme, S subunit
MSGSPRSFASQSNIMRCRVRPDRAIPAYIALWLASPAALRHFRSSAKSAIAQASINQRDVQTCPLALPNLSEQQMLVARLEESRQEIYAHTAELAKLRLLKQGLTDDLLTGRVRVHVEPVPGT